MHDALFLLCCRLVTMGLLFCSMLLILNNLCASRTLFSSWKDWVSHRDNCAQTQWPVHNSVHESPQQFFPWLIQEPAIQNSLASKICHQTFDWVNIISDLVSFFNINELCKTLSGPKEWRKKTEIDGGFSFSRISIVYWGSSAPTVTRGWPKEPFNGQTQGRCKKLLSVLFWFGRWWPFTDIDPWYYKHLWFLGCLRPHMYSVSKLAIFSGKEEKMLLNLARPQTYTLQSRDQRGSPSYRLWQ